MSVFSPLSYVSTTSRQPVSTHVQKSAQSSAWARPGRASTIATAIKSRFKRNLAIDAKSSMTEVSNTGEDHGDAALVRRGDHLGVAHAAARLDDGDRTVLGDHVESVPKWKERVRRDHRSRERQARVGRLDGGNARGVDAAHLARADAQRAPPTTIDDGVGFDESRDAPGEEKVGDLARRRRDASDDF